VPPCMRRDGACLPYIICTFPATRQTCLVLYTIRGDCFCSPRRVCVACQPYCRRRHASGLLRLHVTTTPRAALEGGPSTPIAFHANKRQVLASLALECAPHEWWEFGLHASLRDLIVPEIRGSGTSAALGAGVTCKVFPTMEGCFFHACSST
jgi:hypothetical protein